MQKNENAVEEKYLKTKKQWWKSKKAEKSSKISYPKRNRLDIKKIQSS